ncbi:MAG: metallophosphoesterase [Methanomassiliicoccaceae archaeon]|jgi:putative SbcD/Mre11-related phosphoesterase|nr:metallophosphoesterase [Methanomassiliicoccaceae archaeon]
MRDSYIASYDTHHVDSIEILPGVRASNDRCLILDDGPTVIMGDLHIGYEKALEGEGIYLPRVNTDSIRSSMNRIICRHEPKRIVLLGDIKHDFARPPYECRLEVTKIIRMLTDAAEVIVIKGNHDNFLQNILSDLGMQVLDHVDISGFRLEHGHADSGVRPVIIGHEHPSVRISGAMSGSVKLQCFLYSKESGVLVIPPFSPFSSGNDLSEESFMSDACKKADMDKAQVYGVSEIGMMRLGPLGELRDTEI